MSLPPPVPPPPPASYSSMSYNNPPPIPPLPANYQTSQTPHPYETASPPHFTDPLVAPRPHRVDPGLPANMARTLDEQAQSSARSPQPHQLGVYNPGGFAVPRGPSRGPSPLPPPQGSHWSVTSPPPPSSSGSRQPPTMSFSQAYGAGPSPAMPQPAIDNMASTMSQLSFSSARPQAAHHPRTSSMYSIAQYQPAKPPSPPTGQNGGVAALSAPLPTTASLSASRSAMQDPRGDPAVRIAWARDVLFLVDRSVSGGATSTDHAVGPVHLRDPELQRLAEVAIPIVLQIAGQQPQPQPLPISMAEAIYLRANLSASGAFPELVRHNPRGAFRDFEQAARGGFSTAWFKLGRDYENFNDVAHAKDCFERGMKLDVESCVYRMGMAHLMGQLGLPANPQAAVPLLHRAATLASLEVPQPAYVYALLLLSEFSHVSIPPQLFAPFLPAGSSPEHEARRYLERAAYLNFSPAQYKLGHAYEFASPPFPFDPLLSVQYYSLASQQGEVEADMALSKWFLCGAEGCFDKEEGLALTFAEKAARKGLPSAEFAMGYYAEVGVGRPIGIEDALKWYRRAAEHGNADARDRLGALSQPSPQALSRQEHDSITETKLVRTRTQAKQRSDSIRRQGPNAAANGSQVVDSMRQQAQPGAGGPISPHPRHAQTMGAGPPPHQQQQYQEQQYQQQQQQQQQPQRQMPNAHRYTLVDPGSGSASPAAPSPPPQSNTPRPGMRNVTGGYGGPPPAPHHQSSLPPPSQMPQSVSPVAGAPPALAEARKGPATFAEMGIPTAKAENKECVIM